MRMRFQVLSRVKMLIVLFWIVTCNIVVVTNVSEERSALKLQAASSSETLVAI
jgi:hypothetical protein